MNSFTEMMQGLYKDISCLRQYLEQDKKYLPEGRTDFVEQSNINKLTIKNNIDALIHHLKNHPEWHMFQAEYEKSQSSQHLSGHFQVNLRLWQQINQEMQAIQMLIAVNQMVIQSSLTFYRQIFEQLVKAGVEELDTVYERP